MNHTIFPRPTPWKIAWEAFLAFLMRQLSYCFIFVPPQFSDIYRYIIDSEKDEVALYKGKQEVYHAAIYEMSWQIWMLYCFESWVCGPMLKFWEWRWDTQRLTKDELQAKVEILEERINELARKRSSRIEEEG